MPILNERQKDLLDLIRQDLKEATTSSSGSGRFTMPLSPGIRLFNKECGKGGEGIDDCNF